MNQVPIGTKAMFQGEEMEAAGSEFGNPTLTPVTRVFNPAPVGQSQMQEAEVEEPVEAEAQEAQEERKQDDLSDIFTVTHEDMDDDVSDIGEVTEADIMGEDADGNPGFDDLLTMNDEDREELFGSGNATMDGPQFQKPRIKKVRRPFRRPLPPASGMQRMGY